MPSTSAKQAKFMRAVAHSPKFAKKVGVPQSVGKDYEMADKKMKKFGDGGASKLKLTEKEKKMGDALMMTPRGKQVMDAQKRMEADKEMQRRKKQEAADKLLGIGAKKGGEMKKATKAGRAMTKKSADTMGRAMVKKAGGGKCYAKGGTASARADGIAKKGKTKGKMLAMGGLGSAVQGAAKSVGSGLGSAVQGAAKSAGSGLGSAASSASPRQLVQAGEHAMKLARASSTPTQSASGNLGQVMRANASRNPQNMGSRVGATGRKKGGMVGKKKGGKC